MKIRNKNSLSALHDRQLTHGRNFNSRKSSQLDMYEKTVAELSPGLIEQKRDQAKKTVSFLVNLGVFANYDQPVKILDAGCGLGLLTMELFRLNMLNIEKVVGMDFSEHLIAFAKSCYRGKEKKVVFEVGDLSKKLKYKDECFDVIILTGVLHHFWDCKPVIVELVRTLKIGGRIIIVELNTNNPVRLLSALMVTFSILFLPKRFHLAGHTSEFFHMMGTYKRILKQLGMSVKITPSFFQTKGELMASSLWTDKIYLFQRRLFGSFPWLSAKNICIVGEKTAT